MANHQPSMYGIECIQPAYHLSGSPLLQHLGVMLIGRVTLPLPLCPPAFQGSLLSFCYYPSGGSLVASGGGLDGS